MPEPFRAWYKKKRLEKGYTLEQVAEALGTTHVTIQRYEAGTRKIPLDAVAPMARAIGASVQAATQRWVAEYSGDEGLVRQIDIDDLPVPEGYRDLDDVGRSFVSESLRFAVEQALRMQRRNNIGHQPDEKEDQSGNDEFDNFKPAEHE